MKRICILLTAILFSSLLNAQQTRWFKTSDPTVTASGVITDEITGAAIHSVAVVANGDYLNCTYSEPDGYYSIKVASGEVELSFIAIGYKTKTINLSTEIDTIVNCALQTDEVSKLFYSYIPNRVEFDAKFFNTFGFTNVLGLEQTIFGLEGRYNFRRFPMDVGLNFSYSLPFAMDQETPLDTQIGEVMSYSYWAVQAVTNYNYYRWYKFRPYVGLGVGAGKSSCRRFSGYTQDSEDGHPYATYSVTGGPIGILSLRAGVEIKTYIRIFFEQHFNTDKSRGSYFGFTFVL